MRNNLVFLTKGIVVLILPIETISHTSDVLIVVLEDDNLERMAKADPAEIKLTETGRTLVNPRILLCHEKVTPELIKILKTKDVRVICEYLQRGFEFRPDKGDHDDGPQKMF